MPPTSNPTDDEASPTPHPSLQLTMKRNANRQEAQDQLHTPAQTQVQRQSSYRKRPGPNVQAHQTGRRFGTTPPIPDQQGAMEQKEGGFRASRWEQQTIEKWWTHIAKVYGMIHSPWVSEPELNQATCYEAGQEGPRNQLGQFLDECEIPDNQRKDP